MEKFDFNQGLLNFLQRSPTPFHVVDEMLGILTSKGFKNLSEKDSWEIQPGGKYCISRNDSSLIAFVAGKDDFVQKGIRMVGAHTDSPCLMVKPKPELKSHGYLRLGVEVYGGVLLNPWFDRDLSLAGRIVYKDSQSGTLKKSLINFERAIGVIPSLAIHLDREANKKRSINIQTDLPPVLLRIEDNEEICFADLLAKQVMQEHELNEKIQVMGYELAFYDTQPPAFVGFNEQFIASARLDNLLSCYTGLQALLNSGSSQTCMLVFSDHEEVGSTSACGAQGPFLQTILERLIPDPSHRSQVIDGSLLISADNAHGIHPNYPSLHDSRHAPELNKGPVLKMNTNQRYASNGITTSLFRQWAEDLNIPVQDFVTRSDLACGSTIGPITASKVGVPTLDVGVPTFAMHSIRELAGRDDAHYLYRILREFFLSEELSI